MFRMAYKWKMGVENEGEMAGHWLTLEERRTRGQGGSASPKTMLFWQRVEGNAVHLQRPAKVLEAVQTFLDHVEARGVTEANGTVITEGSPRHHGHVGFA